MKVSMENLYVDIGLKGLKTSKCKICFDQHCSYRLFKCPILFRLQPPLFTSPLKTPYEDV